jgi:glucokinase-like ROK family protein
MPHLPKANRDLMRDINRNLVFNLIQRQGPIARADLARISGLSPATVTGIVNELIEIGLVHEIGTGESSGGRRPVQLCINRGAGFVVGIKLMEQNISSAVTDLDAQVLFHEMKSLPTSSRDPESVQSATVQVIEDAIHASGIERERILGVGIGLAGLIDGKHGIVRYSPYFGWRDYDFAKPISQALKLPVRLENDVNTLTIAEQWFGYGHGKDHFVVVTVGRGIGAGLVVNGQFYRGALGGAGEFGHITLQENGPRCDCGKRGCLEALASDPAVIREIKSVNSAGNKSNLPADSELVMDDIIAAANQGDRLAQQALANSGHWLGIGLANLVNLLNPELVIIGGEGVRAGEWRLEAMRKTLAEHVFNGLADSLEIIVEPSGDEAWARGAACVVLQGLFESPVYKEEIQEIIPSS